MAFNYWICVCGVKNDPSIEACNTCQMCKPPNFLIQSTNKEAVNHPSHYNSHPSGVEAIAICEHFNFNIGNAVKYLWRAGLKGEQLEDLKKAQWYISREIERASK